jgi:GTPase
VHPAYVADVLVRRRPGPKNPMEVRVAIIGNVDSGKSTMVGVLTRSILDDGRGFARSKVFKHGHEEDTGRTSSVSQHSLWYSLLFVAVLPLASCLCVGTQVYLGIPLCSLGSQGEILNDEKFRITSSPDYIARASKVITLVDLAGHERYFKTTAYGLTGHLPDYAMLVLGANQGERRHLA